MNIYARITWPQVADYRLRLRYNVGSGEQKLQLSFVNVSDGQWHTASVDRVGQWVTLTLDTGEGREFNETLGQVQGHAELRISQRGLLAGGDVRFASSDSAPLVNHDFDNGIYLLLPYAPVKRRSRTLFLPASVRVWACVHVSTQYGNWINNSAIAERSRDASLSEPSFGDLGVTYALRLL